jgi:hypothetical protein
MDLHSVKLKFEVFIERNGREEEICPPIYSTEIQNLSNAHIYAQLFHDLQEFHFPLNREHSSRRSTNRSYRQSLQRLHWSRGNLYLRGESE